MKNEDALTTRTFQEEQHAPETSIVAPEAMAVLGSALVDAAQQKIHDDRKERAVTAVAQVMQWMDECAETIARLQRRNVKWQRTLRALKEGAFSVTRTGEIQFNDRTLSMTHPGYNNSEE